MDAIMSDAKWNPLWDRFIEIVRQEVKPALGCTEPVSLALASATAAAQLSGRIERVECYVSPNLLKNGMGVTVPGTGMVGLPIAAALGALGGDAAAGLEVLKAASPEAIAHAKTMLADGRVCVRLQEPCAEILYARACVYTADSDASVTIEGDHTRIIRIEKQGETVFQLSDQMEESREDPLVALSQTTLRDILAFIEQAPFERIRFILDAARLNDALSREGLAREWGLHIGTTLQKQSDRGLLAKDLSSAIVIRTSAASDARMGGATLPAMSNSGSGNQGIAATLPVVVVAESLSESEERLARALMLSHLSAIYIQQLRDESID